MNRLLTSKAFWVAQSTLIVLFCGAFMLLGGFFAVVAAVIGASALFQAFSRLRLLSRFSKMTYTAYKQEHPEHVTRHGVTCHSCGAGRVHVRGLMNHTYRREHFCSQCGPTLYYSPEA